jgi:hypothetical protein
MIGQRISRFSPAVRVLRRKESAMDNLILLCHGHPREFSTFALGPGQTIQYRGNFGAPIDARAARRIVLTLLQDATVTDQQLQREIPNYIPNEPIEGPNTYWPDIDFRGGDRPPCFLVDLSTRRRFHLDDRWSTRLSRVVEALPNPFYLNLICCTDEGISVVEPEVRDLVAVDRWTDVFRDF